MHDNLLLKQPGRRLLGICPNAKSRTKANQNSGKNTGMRNAFSAAMRVRVADHLKPVLQVPRFRRQQNFVPLRRS